MNAHSLLNAVLLGIIQGIAEFLPISSSGHLVLAQELFGIRAGASESNASGLGMNVALHVGTLLSILVVYANELRRDVLNLKLIVAVGIATLPLVVIGLLFKSQLERLFESPLVASAGLLVTASVLVLGQRTERADTQLEQLAGWRAVSVGLFQVFAILPGVSRSGTTIAGGLTVGLSRLEAARFSFLIAIPAITGAAILYTKDLAELEGGLSGSDLSLMLAGALTSFVVGWVCLRWLLKIIARGGLWVFSIYCAAVGGSTLLWQLWRS